MLVFDYNDYIFKMITRNRVLKNGMNKWKFFSDLLNISIKGGRFVQED